MKNIKTTMSIVIIIGVLSIIASLFSLSRGASINSQLWGIFLGVILIGTALIEHNKS